MFKEKRNAIKIMELALNIKLTDDEKEVTYYHFISSSNKHDEAMAEITLEKYTLRYLKKNDTLNLIRTSYNGDFGRDNVTIFNITKVLIACRKIIENIDCEI